MLETGVAGYLSDPEAPIAEAVQAAAQGKTWLSPEVIARMAAFARDDEDPGPAGLTSRESEVLQLVAKGYTNARIAQKLGISKRTVRFHLGNIFARLGVSNRTEAVVEAIRRGLVEMPK